MENEVLFATHEANWALTPTLSRAARAVDSLAELHAHWWDNTQLADIIGRYPDSCVLERYVSHALPGVSPLLTYLGSRLSMEDRNIILRVFDKHPSLLLQRAREINHFTCIHGDPNPGNILSSRNEDGRTYLIDRQPFAWSLTTWIGVSDLAYMMVHWWDTDIRRVLQEPVMRRYLHQLQRLGVKGYTWEKLWADFRLAAMQSFYVVADWNIDSIEQQQMEWVWWPQLQKTLAAFKELNCIEML